MRSRSPVAVLAGVLAAAGCSSPDGMSLYTVRGKVTFEDQPVAQGMITFKAGGPSGRAYSAEIKDGEYTAKVESGQMVVEVSATRVVPGKFDTSNGAKEPFVEMYIPAKYNRSSTLTAEVKPQANDIPFALRK
jgi:hypothetical protein